MTAALTGMNAVTGVAISGDDHLAQSIADIITTPLGSRVMRRDYGSLLFDLLDRPLNPATALLAAMAVAMALARWEPRIEVRTVQVAGDLAAGQVTALIDAVRSDGSAQSANDLTRFSIPLSR